MKNRMVAVLLAAAAMIPGVATAQDGQRQERGARRAQNEGQDSAQAQRQRPAQTDQQRAPRAERNVQRQAEQARQQGDRQRVQRDRNGGAPDMRRGGTNDRQPDIARRFGDRDGNGVVNRRDGRNVPVVRDRNGDGRVDVRRDRDGNGWNGNGGWNRNDTRSNGQRWSGNVNQRWSNNWRQDRRYDWNRYRSYNRGAFHLPRYYAPYGWNRGYNRFSIGIRLAAPLFGQNYWINDPYSYRLPPAYGGYRWIRYYNDAILVDVRSGYVVDVIHDIFW